MLHGKLGQGGEVNDSDVHVLDLVQSGSGSSVAYESATSKEMGVRIKDAAICQRNTTCALRMQKK